MPYQEKTGNIFASSADTLVNTVNCVGAMGKGIALEFRRRFPEMFEKYEALCNAGAIAPGDIWPYMKSTPRVLNFAIKNDWHFPSKIEWIEKSLLKFVANYTRLGITSVAFPWMGAMNGGIPIEQIRAVMRKNLKGIDDLAIEVYDFDPAASDPLFEKLDRYANCVSLDRFVKASGMVKRSVSAVYEATRKSDTTSMTTLIKNSGLGKVSTDRLYAFLIDDRPTDHQTVLFGEDS